MAELSLDGTVLDRFCVARVFKDNSAAINGLDFNASGELLITSADDESLHLYNIGDGKLKKTVFAKKYGASHVRFTHHDNSVLLASKNTNDESIRYLSLHDNRYLRYFKGHRGRVVSLDVSPVDDAFLSAGLDSTIRLWDLRTNACQGLIRVQGRPTAAYDPQGMVFGITCGPDIVKLYDARSYDKGPFGTFHVTLPVKGNKTSIEWSGMKFSPDGNDLLLYTENRVLLLDAFDGKQKHSYTTAKVPRTAGVEADFSPDGQFVLTGTADGKVNVWDTQSGICRPTALPGQHPGTIISNIRWNPTKMMIATGDTAGRLAFWLPKEK